MVGSRRHVWQRVLVALAVVALAGIVPMVVVGPRRADDETTAPPAPPVSSRPPTVLLVGDSLIHQAAAGIRAALPGAVVVDGSVPGSGLLNGPVDWSARAATLLARYHPTVVVASFIGNYDQYAGHLVPGSPPFYEAWFDAAHRLTDQVRATGARVDWVEQPPLHVPNFYGITAERTGVLLIQSRKLASEAGVGLVRADSTVSAPDGSFTTTGVVCGASVTLRIADGVHFTTVGGNWWGVNVGRGVAAVEGLATVDACTAMTGFASAQP